MATEKRYKIADSTRQKLIRIESYLQTTLDMDEEFDTLAPWQRSAIRRALDTAQNLASLASGETADGRTIRAFKTWTEKNAHILDSNSAYYTYA